MPTTGFEDNVAAEQNPPDWTTVGQETTYLQALASEYDTVAYESAGLSVQNRFMHLLRIGHPVAPTKEEAQGKPCVLIVAKQHGSEYAGREGALIFARTLAEATGDLAAWLEDHCVIMIPNANPDSGARDNANGVNLNTDHITVTQPETRVIQQAITDYKPILVMDLHEDNLTNDFEYAGAVAKPVPQVIRDYCADLMSNYIGPRGTAEGYAHGTYPSSGTGRPNTLSQAGGLRYAVTLLIESKNTNARLDRVQCHLDMLDETFLFLLDKADDIVDDIALAKAERIATGLAGSEPFEVEGSSSPVPLNPPPLGYEVTDEQLEQTAHLRELFGIERIRPYIISMGQEAMPLIPFIYDGRTQNPIVSATALTSGVPTEPELSNFDVTDNTPSVDCIEEAGTVHFLTVEHGGDPLDPFDVGQLIQYGVIE